MEADPRHAELIVDQVTKKGARTTTTPGNGMAKEGENGQHWNWKDSRQPSTGHWLRDAITT